jgi:hypothetical protein
MTYFLIALGSLVILGALFIILIAIPGMLVRPNCLPPKPKRTTDERWPVEDNRS